MRIYKSVTILRDASVQSNDPYAIDLATLKMPSSCRVTINFNDNALVGKAEHFKHVDDHIECDIIIADMADPYNQELIDKLDLQPCVGVRVGRIYQNGQPATDCELLSIGLAEPNVDPDIKPLSSYDYI